jgi:hypothetical protein
MPFSGLRLLPVALALAQFCHVDPVSGNTLGPTEQATNTLFTLP